MPDLYRIKDWSEVFENNRTRELKQLTWVALPTRHDGLSYRILMDHKDGAAHYGIWCLLVTVAATCDPRGDLVRDSGEPHTPKTIALMTGARPAIVAEAWQRLESNDVRWLVRAIPQDGAGIPQDGAPSRAPKEGMGGDGIGGERREAGAPPLASPVATGRGSRLPADWQPDETERAYSQSLGLDPLSVAENFRDYWHACSGQRGVKNSWPATWKLWCRRDAERTGAASQPRTPPTTPLPEAPPEPESPAEARSRLGLTRVEADAKAWATEVAGLRERLNPGTFSTWLRPASYLGSEAGGEAVVSAPTEQHRAWLESHRAEHGIAERWRFEVLLRVKAAARRGEQ